MVRRRAREKVFTTMSDASLRSTIEQLWEERDTLTSATKGAAREAVEAALEALDAGQLRVASPGGPGWTVHEWLKKAVLLSFRLNDSVVRRSAYIAPGVVLMPSFVNVGAYVGAETMVDTWATVGSCAQIGSKCHISGGAGIGGVLEPLQAAPVVIEDECFIGARSEVAEGVIVGRGSVLSMGVFLGASTKIVDRATGEVFVGKVPPYSVVVPGNLPGRPLADGTPGPSLYCAVIVKRVDAQTRSKTSINDLLRD